MKEEGAAGSMTEKKIFHPIREAYVSDPILSPHFEV